MRAPTRTELGWLQEESRNVEAFAYSFQTLLTPPQAMASVGLDYGLELDRRIWQHFCASRVIVEGIQNPPEGGCIRYTVQGPHWIDAKGGIRGYAFKGAAPLPEGARWGYAPSAVAQLRATFDAHRVSEPNVADSLGLTAWLVGTDIVLSVAVGAEEPERSPEFRPEEPSDNWEQVSSEWFDWPGDRPTRQRALYQKLVADRVLVELEGYWREENSRTTFGPVFDIANPAARSRSPVYPDRVNDMTQDDFNRLTDEEREALLEWASDDMDTPLGKCGMNRAKLLLAYPYPKYHAKARMKHKNLLSRHCALPDCRVGFVTADGRRKFCDEHYHGGGAAPQKGYEAGRKRTSRYSR